MEHLSERRNLSWIVKIGILFLAYFITARFGLGIHAVNHFATLIWPPTGIALAALFLFGRNLWPAVALGAFFVNLYVGAAIPVALGIALGNTLEAWVGAYVLYSWVKFDAHFARLRDSVGFALTSLFVPLISASIGCTSLLLWGIIPIDQFPQTWIAWWVGDVLGALLVASFLFLLFSFSKKETETSWFELSLMFALTILFCVGIFLTPSFPFVYPLVIPLSWVALRAGPRGIVVALLLLSGIAIEGTLAGLGPFARYVDISQELLYLQLFIGVISTLFLIFGSIVLERRNTMRQLESNIGRLEDALVKTQNADRAKSEFLAILAHELRNPLAPIVSTLELLSLEEKETHKVGLVHRALKQTKIMRRLLDDLLDIARISQKKFSIEKKHIFLQPSIDQAVYAVEPQLDGHTITVHVEENNQAICVNADPDRLTQIFTNILSNAIKFTDPGGNITLTIATEGESAVVTIADNGNGIAPDLITRIFDPFVSIDPKTHSGVGLGLGLALTKRFVEEHGGEISVESGGPGKGSTFVLRFPLVKDPALCLEDASVLAENNISTTELCTVLIVDDNPAVAAALGDLLQYRGYSVNIVGSGVEALPAAQKHAPDVILLDIGLPDLSGYEVARLIRKEKSISPVLVALTGFGQESDKQNAKDAGFDHHLTKPVSFRELEKILKEVKRGAGHK